MAKLKSNYLTINVYPETKAALDKLKIIDREPYDSVIQRLLEGGAVTKDDANRLIRSPEKVKA